MSQLTLTRPAARRRLKAIPESTRAFVPVEAKPVTREVPKLPRAIAIADLLTWAFVTEHAHRGDDWNGRPARGTEWTIYERGALLGTRIDGGRGYLPDRVHDDAETVADAVARLDDPWLVIRAARGTPPDPMVGVIPRVVQARDPITGKPLKPEPATRPKWPDGSEAHIVYIWRGYRRVPFRCEVCQITYSPTHHQIAQARRTYAAWWAALDQLRRALDGRLRDHRLTYDMPARDPWK